MVDYDLPFAILYSALPFLWLIWCFSLFFYLNSAELIKLFFNWIFILISIFILLTLSSQSDANIYQSKGMDSVIFFSNISIMLPFGGILWFILESALKSVGFTIQSLPFDGMYWIWIEITIISVIQALSLMFIKKCWSLLKISGLKYSK